MGSRQTYDHATTITVTPKGRDQVHWKSVFPRGNHTQRFRIYELIISSRTVGEAYKKIRKERLRCKDWDFDNAVENGCISLNAPFKRDEIPMEYKTLNELTNEIRVGSLGDDVRQTQTNGDETGTHSEADTAITDRLWEFATIAENSNLGISEGEERRRIVNHYQWERNSGAARAAKERAKYKCEVCAEKMAIKYGADIGADYAEAHHKIPLSELNNQDVITSVDELVCVCANCHRMLHRLIRDGVDDALSKLKTRVRQAKAAGIWATG